MLSDERVREIEERHRASEAMIRAAPGLVSMEDMRSMHTDRAALAAEVERLKVENGLLADGQDEIRDDLTTTAQMIGLDPDGLDDSSVLRAIRGRWDERAAELAGLHAAVAAVAGALRAFMDRDQRSLWQDSPKPPSPKPTCICERCRTGRIALAAAGRRPAGEGEGTDDARR